MIKPAGCVYSSAIYACPTLEGARYGTWAAVLLKDATPEVKNVTSCWNQSRLAGMGELRLALVSTKMAMYEPLRGNGELRVGTTDGTGWGVSQ